MPSDHEVCPTSIWLSALRSAGRSPKTIESYEAAVGKLREWRTVEGDLATVTRLEALAFVRHVGEQFTPGRVAVRVRALRAGWSWMLAEEMVEANVFARIKVSVPEVAQRTAFDDEIDTMLAHAKSNRRDLAMLTLLVDTGARRQESAAWGCATWTSPPVW